MSPPYRRGGFTLVELVVALPIILVAATILLSTIVTVNRQHTTSAENSRVAEAMRAVFESMRNEELSDVVRLYNADPLDDPKGPGTAPGDLFDVPTVRPVEDGSRVGRVLLPLVDVSDPGGLPKWELREDMQDEALGMPRDLDGNGVVDALDHTTGYRVLPVVLEAEWQGDLGTRTFRMYTLLTEYRL